MILLKFDFQTLVKEYVKYFIIFSSIFFTEKKNFINIRQKKLNKYLVSFLENCSSINTSVYYLVQFLSLFDIAKLYSNRFC